jgi:AbrB family looped-hinge helix DNA binding protein
MPDGDRLKTRVSTKGQVILPKAVRDRHGWKAGTVLEIEDGPNGVTLKPARLFPPTRLEDVVGMLEYNGPPISIEDMHKAIDEEVLARHARGRY